MTMTEDAGPARPPSLSFPEGAAQGTALHTALTCLDDSKAENTITIDIAGKSALGDHMVVASGRSHRHVGAMAEKLVSDLKGGGFGPVRVEGLPHCDWVLIDAGDLIVHIFRPEVREFYNLEKMWTPNPSRSGASRPDAATRPAARGRWRSRGWRSGG